MLNKNKIEKKKKNLRKCKKYKDKKLIPGKKLCCKCYKELDLLLYNHIFADGDAVYEEEEVYLDERLK